MAKLDFLPLVIEYAPLMKLHEKEDCLPCSVSWFEKHVEFYEDPNPKKKKEKEGGGGGGGEDKEENVDEEEGDDDEDEDGGGGGDAMPVDKKHYLLRLKQGVIEKEFFNGEKIKNNECVADCYAHVVIVAKDEATNKLEIQVQYWFLYAMNGAITNNMLEMTGVVGGFHEGDWEHVTIEFEGPLHATTMNIQEWAPQMMYFAAHGAEGRWKHFADVKKEGNTNHPIGYTARHSHATYPRAGNHTRGVATNDKTSDDGPLWRTYNHIILVGITDTEGKVHKKGGKKAPGEKKPKRPKTRWLPNCPVYFQKKCRWGRSRGTLGGAGSGNSPTSPHTKACWAFGCECHQKIDKLTRKAKTARGKGMHDQDSDDEDPANGLTPEKERKFHFFGKK